MLKLPQVILIIFSLYLVGCVWASPKKIHVLVWSEGDESKKIYPNDINGAIAENLKKQSDFEVTPASLKSPGLGLSLEKLRATDVLIWFGHEKHEQVPDAIAQRIASEVQKRGMGFIALHSSHFSKPFKILLNATGAWADYQETGHPEQIKVIAFKHPIAKNIHDFYIPQTEIFVEPFQVPQPDTVVMKGVWDKQHQSREVMTWQIGKGRVVYIRAGHEAYPIYFMPQMQTIIANAVRWASKEKW